MQSESLPLWISAFAAFLCHREGWRHWQGSYSFQTLIFKNKTQTKYQRTTCKYITYFQKSKEAGLGFNYLINQSIDTKGLCHIIFPPSVFCSNGYYAADKNYISLSLSLVLCLVPTFFSTGVSLPSPPHSILISYMSFKVKDKCYLL